MRADHVAVVRGEDDDRVAREAGFVERPQKFSEAVIERGAVRVVAGERSARGQRVRGRDVGTELDFFCGIVFAVAGGRGLVGIMRRAPSELEEERLRGSHLRAVADKVLCIARLGLGVVALPHELLRAVGVVGRLVIGVGAFERLPIVEALPALRGNVVGAAVAIDVPLADHAGGVAGGLEFLRKRDCLRVEGHVVEEKPVRLRSLAGEERGAHGSAHRHAGHRLREVNALALEAIKVRRAHIGIARVAERLRAPLVGDDEEEVGRRLRRRRGGQ